MGTHSNACAKARCTDNRSQPADQIAARTALIDAAKGRRFLDRRRGQILIKQQPLLDGAFKRGFQMKQPVAVFGALISAKPDCKQAVQHAAALRITACIGGVPPAHELIHG